MITGEKNRNANDIGRFVTLSEIEVASWIEVCESIQRGSVKPLQQKQVLFHFDRVDRGR